MPDSPAWLSDRRYNEGIGIRSGDFEFHPSIAGEAGYDSNYFLRSTTSGVSNGPPSQPPIPALEFRVTPAIYLSTLNVERREGEPPPSLAFRFGGNGTFRELVGVSSDPVASQSQNDISSQYNMSASADARLDILPQRPVGGALFATYARPVLPNQSNANPDVSFTQDQVTVGGDVAVQPGGGTLDWHAGYMFSDTIFETNTGKPYNNFVNTAYTRGRWKFRPRTALVCDATLAWYNYTNAASAAPTLLQNSTPVRARFGLDGLITDRFAVLAMLGWGASFYENTLPGQSQFDSLIAQAEVRWFLAASPGIARATDLGLALSSISLGYTRDFQNSYLGSYYTQDRGYLKFYYLFAGRATITLEGGMAAVAYPTLFWTEGAMQPRHAGFTDGRADATAFGEYRFSDEFGVNATFRYTAELSSTVLPISPSTPMQAMSGLNNSYAMQWNRFEAFLGVRWFM